MTNGVLAWVVGRIARAFMDLASHAADEAARDDLLEMARYWMAVAMEREQQDSTLPRMPRFNYARP
jgi:hypothetical protein